MIETNEQSPPQILIEAKKQLFEYFNGKRKVFDLEIDLTGTEFQIKTWNFVSKIPYGKTQTYKDIAILLGSETYTRAVGLANSKNKLPIIIPCHRVIGKNGKLTGYAGGLDRKK